MMLLHADMTHETVTIRGTATKQAGHDVVLVDGVPFVVSSLSSGWCLDGLCGQCQYARCGCGCHGTVLQLIAQTFDVGDIRTGISGRIGSENNGPTGAFAHSNRAYLLNELAESRIDE